MVSNGAFHLVDVGRIRMSPGNPVGNRLRRSLKAALVIFLCTLEEPAQLRAGLGSYPCQCRVQTPWRDWEQVDGGVSDICWGSPSLLPNRLPGPFCSFRTRLRCFSQIPVAELAAKKPFNYPFDFVRHILFPTPQSMSFFLYTLFCLFPSELKLCSISWLSNHIIFYFKS